MHNQCYNELLLGTCIDILVSLPAHDHPPLGLNTNLNLKIKISDILAGPADLILVNILCPLDACIHI